MDFVNVTCFVPKIRKLTPENRIFVYISQYNDANESIYFHQEIQYI